MNAAERKHVERVVALGCIICGDPAEYHHIRRGGGKRDHTKGIPLCPSHHRLGNYTFAVHSGRVGFEQRYGTEAELLAKVEAALGGW